MKTSIWLVIKATHSLAICHQILGAGDPCCKTLQEPFRALWEHWMSRKPVQVTAPDGKDEIAEFLHVIEDRQQAAVRAARGRARSLRGTVGSSVAHAPVAIRCENIPDARKRAMCCTGVLHLLTSHLLCTKVLNPAIQVRDQHQLVMIKIDSILAYYWVRSIS